MTTDSSALDASPVPAPTQPPRASGILMTQLSVMMFLEFAIQGAWLPLLYPFLNEYRGFDDAQVTWILTIGAIGAILSPFAAGQIADRYMNAERVLGLSQIIGAFVVFRMAYATNYTELLIGSFLYGLLYTPTLALVNAVSFRHLPDRDRDFGKVRLWGTVGFICIGIAVGQWLLHAAGRDRALQVQHMGDALRIAAVMGVGFGIYCFFLPRTPPAKERKQEVAPLKALGEVRFQPLLTLFLLSIPVASIHSFYFVRTSQFLGQLDMDAPWIDRIFGVGGAGIMTIGQMAEIFVLALMPVLAKRLSRKVLLSIGLIAYALRFFVLAYLPYPAAILPALALHGFCFGCYMFVAFMVIDEHTTKDVRSSAQNLYNFIIFGVGVIAGQQFSSLVTKWTLTESGATNWRSFYSIPMWVALACLAALLVFYPSRSRIPNREGLAAA